MRLLPDAPREHRPWDDFFAQRPVYTGQELFLVLNEFVSLGLHGLLCRHDIGRIARSDPDFAREIALGPSQISFGITRVTPSAL